MTSARTVIVIPIYQERLSTNEQFALDQLIKVFPDAPKSFVAPVGLNMKMFTSYIEQGFQFVFFDSNFFKSPQTYNNLIRSSIFFKSFRHYEYLLMHHTDAWAFRNEISKWEEKRYSYIGAPIYEFNGTAEGGEFECVGNGGFSMHHIPTAMKVLKTWTIVYPMTALWEWYTQYNWKGKLKYLPYFLISAIGLNRLSHSGFNNLKINEDIWWGKYVAKSFPWYNVAPFEQAYQFSMEFNCKALMTINNHQVPFGCHAWYKPMFKEFWIQHIPVLKNQNELL